MVKHTDRSESVKQTKTHKSTDHQSSRQRIIGFDIDGVLTDEMVGGENIWQREIEAYFPELRLLEPNFSFTAAYGLSLDKVDRFMEERAPNIFRSVTPQAGCQEVLSQLFEMGFTIHLITAREACYEGITRQWLVDHEIRHSALWFEEDKGTLSRRLGIEVFADDYWDNCLDIRDQGIRALLVSAPHNLQYDTEDGIYRVEDWREIRIHLADYYGIQFETMQDIPGA